MMETKKKKERKKTDKSHSMNYVHSLTMVAAEGC